MNYIILALKGIAIGIANAVPGVSGGTIAVVAKIYDRLLEAITPNIKKLIKNIPFLLPVGIGMGIGILAAARLFGFLFEEYNVPTQLFFIGVIIGSMPMIYKQSTSEKKLSPICILPFAAGIGVMVVTAMLSPSEAISVSELDLFGYITLCISGIIAAIAMVIPGISGSLILKVLGRYDLVINAINSFDLVILIVFAVGVVIGIFAAASIISFLLKRWRRATYCFIAGLILGSVPSIFPSEFAFNTQGIVGIILFIVGLAVPMLFELPTKKAKN